MAYTHFTNTDLTEEIERLKGSIMLVEAEQHRRRLPKVGQIYRNPDPTRRWCDGIWVVLKVDPDPEVERPVTFWYFSPTNESFRKGKVVEWQLDSIHNDLVLQHLDPVP